MIKEHRNKTIANTERPSVSKKKNHFILTPNIKLAALLGLVSILIYANTLTNGFVLDDFSVLTKNSIVTRGISAIPEILSTPYRRGFIISTNDLYRPLSLIMFAAELQFFNGLPIPGHFINIILFAGCVILLFFFLEALFEKKKTSVAFIASMLFALHPIHTEVVANIKSRDELLCFFFAFAALNVFIKYIQESRKSQLILGAALFFLALLSKETAITFLAVVPFVFFFYRNESKSRSIHITLSVVTVSMLFLIIRFLVLHAYNAGNTFDLGFTDNMLAKAPSIAEKYATAIYILGLYIKLLLVPYPLISDYSYSAIHFVNFNNIWVLASLTAYIFLLVFSLYRLSKRNKDPFAFAGLFYLIAISLFSNIPFLIGAAMAERFTFFASAGFCLLMALVIQDWIIRPSGLDNRILINKKVLAILIPVSFVYTIITFNRNIDWSDGLKLFRTDTKKSPENFRLFYYLGSELLLQSEQENDVTKKRNLEDEGIDAMKKSMAVYPNYVMVPLEIGNAYLIKSQFDSAERYCRLALTLDPKNVQLINKLAGAYFKQQRYFQSLQLCKTAVELDPSYVRGYRNIGSCFLRLEKPDSAIIFLKKAMILEPDFVSTYDYLAVAFKMTGNMDSAKKYEALAAQLKKAF